MVNLKQRWDRKELLDSDDIPFTDIKVCLRELNSINTLLGGHAITLQGVKEIFGGKEQQLNICEIGCGGGDNLAAIAKKYTGENISLSFTGIDLKSACTDFAADQYPLLPAKWVSADYKKAKLPGRPDIIFSSLFCHHFSNEELVTMLQWMQENSRLGFFINDLQRSTAAYYLIKWLTAAFSRSYLVKNDGCISVGRSFRKKDWELIFKKAGIHHYSIRWKWAFRYLIICKK